VTRLDDVPHLVELGTIAKRFGVTETTVRAWWQTHHWFPVPSAYLERHQLAGAPLWDWSEVENAVDRWRGVGL
jgi:uncharacterized protein YjcR